MDKEELETRVSEQGNDTTCKSKSEGIHVTHPAKFHWNVLIEKDFN